MYAFCLNNMMFRVVFISTVSSLVIMTIRHKCFGRTHVFFIADWGLLFCIYKYIEQLPTHHEKLYTALSTTASVIKGSSEYLACFERMSNICVENIIDIASFLYYLDPSKWDMWETVIPSILYEHLFNVFEQILGAGVFGYVHHSVWNEYSPTVLYIILESLCVGMFIAVNKEYGKVKLIIKLCLLFLFFSSTVGTFVATFTLVMIEMLIHMFLKLNDDEFIKMEKCQDA